MNSSKAFFHFPGSDAKKGSGSKEESSAKKEYSIFENLKKKEFNSLTYFKLQIACFPSLNLGLALNDSRSGRRLAGSRNRAEEGAIQMCCLTHIVQAARTICTRLNRAMNAAMNANRLLSADTIRVASLSRKFRAPRNRPPYAIRRLDVRRRSEIPEWPV